jgi:hypothetical protein
MDRRHVLGAAVAALGGVWIGLPASAAELAKRRRQKAKPVKWVILNDPADKNLQDNPIPSQLCLGGFLYVTKRVRVKASDNKLLGASGTIANNTFTGQLLTQVPPYTHAANAITVIRYKDLSDEAQDTTTALNYTLDVIAALIAPNRDALDQIRFAINKIDTMFATIAVSERISDEQESAINDFIAEARGDLNEADAMIRQPKVDFFAVAAKILEAANALQQAFLLVPWLPPTE